MKLPFLFFILLFTPVLWAQGTDSDILIWVRANELDARPADAVFSREDLQKKSNTSLGQILSQVSGGYAPVTSSGGQFQSYFLQGSKSEHVLVLLDGVPINDVSSPSGGFDYSLMDVSQLERIEVYKGSHAVRYGSQAFAGVVLLISKKANTLQGGRALVGGGTAQTAKAQLTGWGSLSSQSRILGSVSHSQGYEGSSAAENDGNIEVDGYQKWSSLLALVSESFDSSFRLSQFHTQSGVDYDYSAGPNGDDPNAKSATKMLVTMAVYERIISDRQSFQARIYNQNFRRWENDAADSLHVSFLQSEFKSMVSGTEFIYDFNFSEGDFSQRYLTGISFEYNTLDTNSRGSFSQEIRKDNRHQSSLFLIPSFGFAQKFYVNPGFRLECGKDHCWQQKEIAMIFKEFTLRAAESFRAPSFYQLYSAYGVASLQEEKVHHLSLSYNKNFDGTLLGIMAHKNNYFDLIDYNSVTNKYINRGKVNTHGLDFSVSRQLDLLAKTWNNKLNLAYLQSKDVQTGLAMPRRPRLVATVQNLIEITEQWHLGPDFRYRSRMEDVDGTGARVHLTQAFAVNLFSKYTFSDGTSEVQISLSNIANNQVPDFWGYAADQRALGIDFIMNL